jgi:putative PIN family toxin of toxin-antitoxin system
MIPLVTPDTNVIVSGTITPHGPPGQILDHWRAGRIEFALCPSLLAETRTALSRPKMAQYGFSTARAKTVTEGLRSSAVIVPGTAPVDVCEDPTDNMLFACAYEAGADYIVSGDEKHVLPVGSFQGIPVVRPTEFAKLLARHERKQAA